MLQCLYTEIFLNRNITVSRNSYYVVVSFYCTCVVTCDRRIGSWCRPLWVNLTSNRWSKVCLSLFLGKKNSKFFLLGKKFPKFRLLNYNFFVVGRSSCQKQPTAARLKDKILCIYYQQIQTKIGYKSWLYYYCLYIAIFGVNWKWLLWITYLGR
jgi:hypothetical protein